MPNAAAKRTGRHSRRRKAASCSSQKSHTGRRGRESRLKNNAAPPAMPSRIKPRSCPLDWRRMKRKTAIPTAWQYSRSKTAVSRGQRSRSARIRSYSTPRAAPSTMDRRNSHSWLEI